MKKMNKGFFSQSKIKSKRKSNGLAQCGRCGLHKNCLSPKMPPTGEGRKKILFIAEAPGKREDEQNTQLIGDAGRLLRRYLRSKNINLDTDCWKTNACCCRRESSTPPENYMIEACRPNVFKVIKKYKPNVIILLGRVAMKSVLGSLWKENIGTASKWGGLAIPCRNPNAWIVPTLHPSHVLVKKDNPLIGRLFRQQIKLGLSKAKNKPWDKPKTNNSKQIEIIIRPSQAAKKIYDMQKREKYASAFDYETNSLKPETEGAEIISCSICWGGRTTIAFPWAGEAIEAVSNYIKSPSLKIASNLKFEDRWTRVKLGHGVRNWWYDTMIGSHVLNNAPGITSLKFQAFVLLGQEPYDDHIKPLLKSNKENKLNQIHKIDIQDLLLYNGLDSLLEYKVAMKQIKQLEE